MQTSKSGVFIIGINSIHGKRVRGPRTQGHHSLQSKKQKLHKVNWQGNSVSCVSWNNHGPPSGPGLESRVVGEGFSEPQPSVPFVTPAPSSPSSEHHQTNKPSHHHLHATIYTCLTWLYTSLLLCGLVCLESRVTTTVTENWCIHACNQIRHSLSPIIAINRHSVFPHGVNCS